MSATLPGLHLILGDEELLVERADLRRRQIDKRLTAIGTLRDLAARVASEANPLPYVPLGTCQFDR